MRNFYRIAQNIDVSKLLLAIHAKEHLWNQNTLRTDNSFEIEDENGEMQTVETPHREIDDIWLRMNDLRQCAQSNLAIAGMNFDHRESIDYPAYLELPEARTLIMALMNTVGGERLGRCMISRMKPGMQIYPHSDIGDDLSIYYDNEQYYSRFHIVLQGLPGSIFVAGDEQVNMRTGEAWWFDGASMHSVVNNSEDDRIHLVVDIKVSGEKK